MKVEYLKVISYRELLQRLASVSLPITLSMTPLNLIEEREKFFKSNNYNPIFNYPTININNVLLNLEEISKLRYIEGLNPNIVPYVKKIIKSKLKSAKIINNVGNDAIFNSLSIKKFVLPSEIYVSKAQKVLRGKYKFTNINENISDNVDLKYNSSDVSSKISEFFNVLGLKVSQDLNIFARNTEEYMKTLKLDEISDTWRIIYSKSQGSAVKIGSKFRVVFVPGNILISLRHLKKILIHEIGTHALRSTNGFLTGFEFLGKPTISSYLYTEEGLTAYNELKYGIYTRKNLYKSALLLYNVYLSHIKKYTFRQLYDLNICFLPPKEAFSVAYRVKRGLKNTSLSGGYTKDSVYFKGLLLTSKRIRKDKKLYGKLYSGKIPFSWVSLVDDKIIQKPQILMDESKVNDFLSNLK